MVNRPSSIDKLASGGFGLRQGCEKKEFFFVSTEAGMLLKTNKTRTKCMADERTFSAKMLGLCSDQAQFSPLPAGESRCFDRKTRHWAERIDRGQDPLKRSDPTECMAGCGPSRFDWSLGSFPPRLPVDVLPVAMPPETTPVASAPSPPESGGELWCSGPPISTAGGRAAVKSGVGGHDVYDNASTSMHFGNFVRICTLLIGKQVTENPQESRRKKGELKKRDGPTMLLKTNEDETNNWDGPTMLMKTIGLTF